MAEQRSTTQSVGIGGWLILPAVGLLLALVRAVRVVFAAVVRYPKLSAAGYGGVYALYIGLEAAFMLFILFTIFLFLTMKKTAPLAAVILMITRVTASFLVFMIQLSMGARGFASQIGLEACVGAIAAAVWVPYFLRSKRVRATFVR